MIDEVVVPTKIRLDKAEETQLASIENAPYTLQEVEQCYCLNDASQTHETAKELGLAQLIGQTANDTLQNVKLFIHLCLKRSEKNQERD
jgi:hypothetical protein